MSHPPAIRLAEQLARIAPAGLGHAMFASDGSCAVEAALKIALQYWTNQGESHHTRFVTLQDGCREALNSETIVIYSIVLAPRIRIP